MLPAPIRAALLALLLLGLGPGLAAPGSAAQPALPAAAAAASGTASAASGAAGAAQTPTAAQIDALLRELRDPEARAALIAKLEALRAAGAVPAAESAPEAAAAETVLDQASRLFLERLDATFRVFASLGELLSNLPQLGDWLAFQLENEFRRELWGNVARGVVQALGVAALVAWLVARLVRRRRPAGPLSGLARLRAATLDLVPATVFAGVTGLVLDQGGFLPVTARIVWLLVAAVLIDRVLTVAARHLAAAAGLDGAAAPPDSPASMLRAGLWIARLVVWGSALLLAAGRLGLPPDLFDALASLLTILVAAALTAAILARRVAIERAMRSLGRWVETDFLRRLLMLDRLIESAHLWLVALVWLNAALLVLGLGWGPARATIATLVVLAAAHLALTWLDRPAAAPPPASEGEEPGEPAPAAATPLGTRLLKAAVKLVALVLLLEAWGVGIVAWLASPEGHAALAKGLRIALILAVCWGLWRLSSWWIGGYIAARDEQGNVRYSNRARTAAAIARSVIVVLLVLIATTTVLGELGVQATPLLAGAGVVGLAVGFGSQKLVQDIINGLFILLGDTIRVGDVVDLGGRAGVVEAISMRTVTLRSYNGDVHTIPFGTIDSITNMTRDFSFWVLDLGIGYRENVDRVVAVLHEIDGQLRREWPWRRLILEPLEIAGLDRFGDSAVVIRGRVKTRPGEQWRVGREFNRRIKRRFDELGIEIPFPQRTVHLVAEPAAAAAAAPLAAAPFGARPTEEPRGEPARPAAGRG